MGLEPASFLDDLIIATDKKVTKKKQMQYDKILEFMEEGKEHGIWDFLIILNQLIAIATDGIRRKNNTLFLFAIICFINKSWNDSNNEVI